MNVAETQKQRDFSWVCEPLKCTQLLSGGSCQWKLVGLFKSESLKGKKMGKALKGRSYGAERKVELVN